jgi:hypothetical protein
VLEVLGRWDGGVATAAIADVWWYRQDGGGGANPIPPLRPVFRVLRPGMAGQSGIGAVPEVRSPRDNIDGGGLGPMQA